MGRVPGSSTNLSGRTELRSVGSRLGCIEGLGLFSRLSASIGRMARHRGPCVRMSGRVRLLAHSSRGLGLVGFWILDLEAFGRFMFSEWWLRGQFGAKWYFRLLTDHFDFLFSRLVAPELSELACLDLRILFQV